MRRPSDKSADGREATAEPPKASRVKRATAITGLAIGAVLLYTVLFGSDNGHQYTFQFQNAGQLVEDNQVLIGGYPAGTINEIDLSDDALAEIHVTLDQELHEGSKATIRATGLAGVANHYVSVEPGPNSAPKLTDGATLTLPYTTTSVDLDQLFNAFTPRLRQGLKDFIQGNAAIYAGRSKDANETYKYFDPALAQTNKVLDELNADKRMFERFVVSSSKVMTAVGERADDLEASVSSANTAFDAIARENQALSASLDRLPGTFRQSNTAFVNLRAALDDLDSLVDTAKPATEDLAPFLRRVRPVVDDSVPVFRDLRLTLDRPGKTNDLDELTSMLPEVQSRAERSFGQAATAIDDFQPTLEFARSYSPEMLNSLAKLGQITANYDANGHYARAKPVDINIFDYDEGSGLLEAIAPSAQYDAFGDERILTRCPGGATQPAPDNSNPFVAPLWPGSGLTPSDCDPAAVPAGP